MKAYEIFRRGARGHNPVWMKGEENLEIAKLEAMRFAAKDRSDYIVVDLATLKVLYETEDVTRRPKMFWLR